MRNPSEALDHSLVAFCAIQTRVSGQSVISYDETVQLYNQALSKIIGILGSPSAGNSDESLAAIVILSTCEVSRRCSSQLGLAADMKQLFLFHASSSWDAHAQGISEILRSRVVSGTNTQSWSDLCRRLCVICVCTYQSMVQFGAVLIVF
jgi:hypothetical protein